MDSKYPLFHHFSSYTPFLFGLSLVVSKKKYHGILFFSIWFHYRIVNFLTVFCSQLTCSWKPSTFKFLHLISIINFSLSLYNNCWKHSIVKAIPAFQNGVTDRWHSKLASHMSINTVQLLLYLVIFSWCFSKIFLKQETSKQNDGAAAFSVLRKCENSDEWIIAWTITDATIVKSIPCQVIQSEGQYQH